MDTYEALFDYFAHLPTDTDEITLTFEQVEDILGRALPPGAWHYRTWWEFPGGTRVPAQVRAWEAAGWRVYMVDQHAGWAWFRRLEDEEG